MSIDQLSYSSALRYVNTAEKCTYAMLTLLFCVVSRSVVVALFVLSVNSILIIAKNKTPFRRYMHLMMIPITFLFLGTIAVFINVAKTPLDAFALPMGSWYLTGSYAGLRHGVQLVLTALSSVSCLYFIALTTPMTDILTLLQDIHCPAMLVELMLLIYRFIFILTDVASSISVSQKARLSNRNFRTALQSFGSMVSVLLIRALKRSNAVYDAMESRCYDGVIHVLTEHRPARIRHMIWIAAFELFLLMIVIGRYIWMKSY